MSTFHDFSAVTLDGDTKDLSEYAGRVLLVVNTATKCGFAPQFEGLEQLHSDFADQGFAVLGFPSNQFNGQEPGTSEQIMHACRTEFGVSFPLFSKIDVNRRHQHPVFAWMKSQRRSMLGRSIKWNFTKFLIGRDGRVIKRYAPATKPRAIAADIRAALES